MKAIGVNVRISAEEVASFLPKLTSGDYDLLISRVSVGSSAGFSPDYVYLGYLSGSPSNFNKYPDDQMDDLLKKAVSVPAAEAPAIWRQIQERDVDTLGQIQLVTARYVEAYGKGLANYQPSPLTMFYGIPEASIA